jgi:hypothetical protein
MVDDGLGFSLVPWTPAVEKQIGQHISEVARPDGGVDWRFGRKRGLGLSMKFQLLLDSGRRNHI